MYFHNFIPLFRLVFPFIAGIILAIYSGDKIVENVYPLIVLVLIFLALFALIFFTRNIAYKSKRLYGAGIHTLAFLLGILVSIIQTERFYPNHISQSDETVHTFFVMARDVVHEKEKTFKLDAEILCKIENGEWKNAHGKVIFYLQKDSIAAKIKYGDVLLVSAALQPLRDVQNPAQFDYKQFLIFHQITRQAYIPSGNFIQTGVNKGNYFLKKISTAREYMLDVLRKHNFEGDEFAVAAALLLGYKDELDPVTMRAYSGAGAMHVLAVSGLHVGILYAVALLLLGFLDKVKHGNILKTILLLLFLYGYAALTGFSPSVLRATVMFTFVILSKPLRLFTSIYNTLAASAVLLLAVNPYLIMQVGFQLSYLAVLGIVAIQPPLAALWQPENKIISWAWEITCVSVAAQIATAPLGFLYFHQFPVYFMFSNLIVIPAATIILYLGFATLVFSFFEPLCSWLAYLLKGIVLLLNKTVSITGELPYSILGGIDISVFETWLFYAAIFALFIFFTKKNMNAFFVALVSFLFISVTQFIEAGEQVSQRKFIVYYVPGTSVFEVIEGRQTSFYAPLYFSNDKDKMLFNIEHNWWKCGVEERKIIPLNSPEDGVGVLLFSVGNKRGIQLNSDFDFEKKYSGKLRTDFLILSDNMKIRIEKAIEYFNPEIIIFDSSNSKRVRNSWKKQCEKLKVGFYDVMEQGAFVVEY